MDAKKAIEKKERNEKICNKAAITAINSCNKLLSEHIKLNPLLLCSLDEIIKTSHGIYFKNAKMSISEFQI